MLTNEPMRETPDEIPADGLHQRGWVAGTDQVPNRTRWLGAYKAYMEAMTKAAYSKPATVCSPPRRRRRFGWRMAKTQVLDGPYADSKEQLGGFHIIDVADLDAAISWAARSPTALHGVVEVRPLRDSSDDPLIQSLIDTRPGIL